MYSWLIYPMSLSLSCVCRLRRSDVCDLIIGVAAGVAGVLVVVGGLAYRSEFIFLKELKSFPAEILHFFKEEKLCWRKSTCASRPQDVT